MVMEVLGEDLERVASSYSDAASSQGESITITLLPDDAESITITIQSNYTVQDIIQEAMKLSAAQIRSMVVSLGGEAVEMTVSLEQNGIEDGARLEVSLLHSIALAKPLYLDGTYGDSETWTLKPDGSCKYHYNRGHDVYGERDEYITGTFTLRTGADAAKCEAVIVWTRTMFSGCWPGEDDKQLDEWYDLSPTKTELVDLLLSALQTGGSFRK